jgi:arylsulfatase A-like enzyme
VSKNVNFLLFVTDQHRADHLGCYGNPILRTPSIDGLAKRGLRFERCYVANPICMPNRASLMTGRMPSLHGVRTNGIPLAKRHRTFVEALREAGYQTALIGKSHLQNMTGWERAYTPPEAEASRARSGEILEAVRHDLATPEYDAENTLKWRADRKHHVPLPYYGFDHVDLCTMHGDGVGAEYERWLRSQGVEPDSIRGSANALRSPDVTTPQAWRTRLPEDLYPTSFIRRRAVDFLETRIGRSPTSPFFIQCNFPDPHHPFTPPGKYWDMYRPDRIPVPESHGAGDSPMLRHLRDALEQGTAVREKTVPYAVTEKEAQGAIALTYGMLSMVDDAIGAILDKVAKLGLADETVVLFTSDHGDYMGDHGILLKGPMHYQGLVRVPLIWSEPQAKEPGTTDALVSTLDIPTSVLIRAGLQPFYGTQGRDLTPLVSRTTRRLRECVLVEDDRELVYLGFDRPQRVRTIVTRRHRLSLFRPSGWAELFDLENDPHEIRNLWSEDGARGVRAELMEALLYESIDAQDWTPLPTGRA